MLKKKRKTYARSSHGFSLEPMGIWRASRRDEKMCNLVYLVSFSLEWCANKLLRSRMREMYFSSTLHYIKTGLERFRFPIELAKRPLKRCQNGRQNEAHTKIYLNTFEDLDCKVSNKQVPLWLTMELEWELPFRMLSDCGCNVMKLDIYNETSATTDWLSDFWWVE